MEQQYKKLGGTFELILRKGEGHHPHGLQDPQPVVDFIQKHAAPPVIVPAHSRQTKSMQTTKLIVATGVMALFSAAALVTAAEPAAPPAEERPLHLVPWPTQITIAKTRLKPGANLAFLTDNKPPAMRVAEVCKEDFQDLGFAVAVGDKTLGGPVLAVRLQLADDSALGEEGYRLQVAREVVLTARTKRACSGAAGPCCNCCGRGLTPRCPISPSAIVPRRPSAA